MRKGTGYYMRCSHSELWLPVDFPRTGLTLAI